MSASPEFYKPAAAPAFSPPCATAPTSDYDYYGSSCCCRTPTGSGITYLREPTTCPPAPRKPPPPPPCRKRLFQPEAEAEAEATVISLRLDELERLFRPHPPNDKPRRSRSRSRSARKHDDSSTKLQVNSS